MRKWILPIILILIVAVILVSADYLNIVVDAHGEGDTQTFGKTTDDGVQIVINNKVYLLNVTKFTLSTATQCVIWNTTDAGINVLATGTFVKHNCSFSGIVLAEGAAYNVTANAGGAARNRRNTAAPSFPIADTNLNWTGGIDGNASTAAGILEVKSIMTADLEPVPKIKVTLLTPANAQGIALNTSNFTCNATPVFHNLTNATYHIWFSNGTLFNKTTNLTFLATDNSSKIEIDDMIEEDYKWNVYVCGLNVTGYLCDWASANYTFNIGTVINAEIHNSTSYETENEYFEINLTIATGTPTSAKLWYNGTSYTATITAITGNNYTIERTIDVPDVSRNYTYNYEWTVSGSKTNSSNYTQLVNNVTFGLCNSTLTITYLNISFRDEDTSAWINASMDSSTWRYWLGSGTTSHSYSHINNTNNTDYEFCLDPQNKTVTLNYTVQYSLLGYPQRRYTTEEDYTNISTNKTLYLLASADGIYVTFQVLSAAGQPIEEVFGNASRNIGGTKTLVGSGYTGADGGVTFWLNPDYTHNFAFEKTGYDLYTTTLTPTQSSYTIYLSSVADETNVSDFHRGINYNIEPEAYVLGNDTSYEFNFTIISTYWTLDEFGFVLRNDTGGTVLGSDSDTTGTGGTTRVTIDTKQNTTIVMDYYWLIDGNYTNMTRSWHISDIADYGFSIKTFFIDLRNYANQKTLGLNTFSLNLIIFVLIFLIVGGICYVAGVYSPAAVMWMIFALVALFDFGTELIYNPINAVPYFPTIFTLFMALGFTIWEVSR